MTQKTKASSTKAKPKMNNPLIPIQMQQISLPTFEEKIVSGKNYVRYGSDNLFPQFLISLADKSALHNAIVASKLDYSYAKGLVYEGPERASTSFFIARPNPNETLNEVFRKCLYDYIIFGAFAINIIWDITGQFISQIYHIDLQDIRSGIADERGKVNKYYYSDNWLKCSGNDKCKEIGAFDTQNRIGSQLLYVKDWRPGAKYYALPSYVGALNSIATDCEITNFHLANIKNGMAPSKFITISSGFASDEEQMTIKRQLESLYTGSDAAGKFFLSFTNDPEKAPKIDTLTQDGLDQQFIQLEDSVLQQILSGHRVTSPLLVGLRNGGGLGSNTDELMTAYKIFQNTVITPIQNTVAEAFNFILSFTKGYSGGKLKPTSNQPLSFTWSEQILSTIMTKNEMRARIGLAPIEDMNINDIQEDTTINNQTNVE